MGYEDDRESDRSPRDTRRYGGILRRTAWRARRWAERQLSYSEAEVRIYEYRLKAHSDDPVERDVYRAMLDKALVWNRYVWQPLARLTRATTALGMDYEYDAVWPGDRSIAKWLDEHAHLAHSTTGHGRLGFWLDWFSLDAAPWSGQREDWLLWTDGDMRTVDGPLSSIVAQSEFMTFDAQVQEYIRSGQYPGLVPTVAAPAAASLMASEGPWSDRWLEFPDDDDDFGRYLGEEDWFEQLERDLDDAR